MRFARSVIFYREYQYYTGGHQKVADYFHHLESSVRFQPYIALSAGSVLNVPNPFRSIAPSSWVTFDPKSYDIAFLAGEDWGAYLRATRPTNQPVINLI